MSEVQLAPASGKMMQGFVDVSLLMTWKWVCHSEGSLAFHIPHSFPPPHSPLPLLPPLPPSLPTPSPPSRPSLYPLPCPPPALPFLPCPPSPSLLPPPFPHTGPQHKSTKPAPTPTGGGLRTFSRVFPLLQHLWEHRNSPAGWRSAPPRPSLGRLAPLLRHRSHPGPLQPPSRRHGSVASDRHPRLCRHGQALR